MRFGPLHSVGSQLVVGDPGRRHLVLLPDAVHYRNEDAVEATFAWDGVSGVRLSLPTTRLRFPAAVSGVALSALTLFVQDDPQISPKDGAVAIDGDEAFESPLSCHHLGGYWRRTVDVSQDLIARFVEEPASRTLLHYPDRLIETVSFAARRRE